MIERARAIADAVLYEGFLLFPYAKRALKNHMPFQFGVVMPQGYADPTEPSFLRSQFVLCHSEVSRQLPGMLRATAAPLSKDPELVGGLVRFLEVVEEPVEREVPFAFRLADEAVCLPFIAGALRGEISLEARGDGDMSVVTLTVRNHTTVLPDSLRNEALRGALVSAHVLLEAHGGTFASMLDPPQAARDAVASCMNERVFPVLAGEPGDDPQTSPVLLVSPIILYDFPRIAPASRARTFDGTEIDELLMLSVASLSEQEKQDARAAHPYVRELVERAEAFDADAQQSLHGEVTIGGIHIRPGSRVRVVPKGRADVWDDLVRGMTAHVSAVHTDVEGKRYVGVLFDADPASEMHEWYGRSFFYGVDEVEPLT